MKRKQSDQDLIKSLGFWSSIIFTVLLIIINILYVIMLSTVNPSEWQGVKSYASSFKIIEFFPVVAGLLMLPFTILTMVSIHFALNEKTKIWSIIGVIFCIMFATITGIAYFTQIAVVLPSLIKGNYDGLEQLVFANNNSLMWALNYFGWGFLGLSTLFMSFVFNKDKLQTWVKRLFFLYGIFSSIALLGFLLDNLIMQLGLVFSWFFILPLSTSLLSIVFKKL